MDRAVTLEAKATPAERLPELRQDLRIIGDATDLTGQKYWKVYDPLSHRFTALSRRHMAMLGAWSGATVAEEVIDGAWRQHAEIVTAEEVAQFAAFLIETGLATPSEPGSWRKAFEAAERQRGAYLSRLVKGYLFFKVPLADPERFLKASLRLVRPLGTKTSLIVFILLAIADIALVLREWDQFAASAVRLASWSGLFQILPAILLVKLLHELAHGYVATHHGCRVKSMGVAFMLGTPLLYVDVSDSWRLHSRKAQLQIGAAGIAADLAVSAVALLAWVFLPDGALRSIAFNLATAGLITSLMMNLNPFMRFDGYYLLADAIGMPNMQARAMALARWRLRETLFKLDAPPPETFEPRIARWLVLYGYSVWIYRAVLFISIALVVYHYFFKLLGIILFAVEIIYFILFPLWSELKEWYLMRHRILATGRTRLTLAGLAALVLIAIVPWSDTIRTPAALEPSSLIELHTPVASRIVSIEARTGAKVTAGSPLLRLHSDALEFELRAAELKANVVDVRLNRIMSDARDREQAAVLRQERAAIERKITGIRQRITELVVTSPIDGEIAGLADYVAVGRWVTPAEPLVVIHGTGAMRVRGLVDADDRARVRPGMKALFVPNDLMLPSLAALIATVSDANVAVLDQVSLAQSFGGGVPTLLNSKRQAVPVAPQYRVEASLSSEALRHTDKIAQPVNGVLHAAGEAESLLARVWRRVLIVLIRESGF